MTQNNLRPGVYASYRITSRYITPLSSQWVGVVAPLPAPLCGTLHLIASLKEAKDLLEGQSVQTLLLACQLLLEIGVSTIALSGVDNSYSEAALLLSGKEDVGVVLPLMQNQKELLEVLKVVCDASEKGKERLLVVGSASSRDALDLATQCNNPRGIVVFGNTRYQGEEDAFFGAAAFGGLLVSTNNPRQNLNGAPLPWVTLSEEPEEDVVQLMLSCGVTPLETVGGMVSCVRGVTSKTTTQGLKDTTFRSINTTLLIDDVIRTIRKRLELRLKTAQMTRLDMDSIRTQVVLELEDKKKLGILSTYQMPLVGWHKEDPSVCLVELTFTIAQVLSQIHLVAEVQL